MNIARLLKGISLTLILMAGYCHGQENLALAAPLESNSAIESEANLLLLAETGDVQAQFQLATLYDKGELGEESNQERAFFWYEKAALQGHPVACYNLGNAYKHGRGTVQSESLANYWWQKGADAGLASAQFNLALQYYRGLGVEKDGEKAVLLINQAAANGHQKALSLIESNRVPKRDLAPAPVEDVPARTSDAASTREDDRGDVEGDWLATRNPEHFCIQLAVMANPDNIRAFKKQYDLGESAKVVAIVRGGQSYHYLLFGEYNERQAAAAALATLPKDILRHKPWPRSFGQLQALSREFLGGG